MRSPVRALVDRCVRCTRCGAPPGCACWQFVTLRCPGCKREQRAEREGDEVAGSVVLLACPDCGERGT